MKKLLASLLFSFAMLFAVKASVLAQAQIPPAGTAYPTSQSYFSAAVGTPAIQFNSAGTNYGQCFSDPSLQQWSCGYGTSLTANGTAAIAWDVNRSVGLGAGTGVLNTALGLVVIKSTATTNLNPVLNVQSNVGNSIFEVFQDSHVWIASQTKAQLNATTPGKVGELIICSDCTNTYALLVATGTATVAAYRELGVAGTGVR